MTKQHSEQVTIINILEDGELGIVRSPLFSEPGVRYVIPIYQRAFAWGIEKPEDVNYENEIERLMDDVYDLKDETESYYIGTLVVWRRPDSATERNCRFEVIDGQQRLTALCILLKCLDADGFKIGFKTPLDYDCRKKSALTMKKLDEVITAIKKADWKTIREVPVETDGTENKQWKLGEDDLENSICDAVKTIFQKKNGGYYDKLFKNLKKVRLFRIEVPEDTDLNKYFEIMNVRGRQLEQSDIVKARLMEWLDSDKKKEWFARIWNACRDMSGYVQMHFAKNIRKTVFGTTWESPPTKATIETAMGIREGESLVATPIAEDPGKTTIIDALLNPEQGINTIQEPEDGNLCDDDNDDRFGSIIEFPQFLLHVLKVFGGRCDDYEATDAQVLAKKFEERLEKAPVANENANRAWDFIICLLKCRFLFDKYFIKRDYGKGSPDGEWSLKELKERNGKPDFKDQSKSNCLMIQSCLRVTYRSLKQMHWVTNLLGRLYNTSDDANDTIVSKITEWCEDFAKNEARNDWKSLKEANWRLGTKTPHLLFNYLDYLLWKNDTQKPFVFEFRNSVEHWYPQNPDQTENSLPDWNGVDGQGRLDRDRFGNLCLLTVKMNSRFSNLPPVSKATYDKSAKSKGSLKYRAMIDIMEGLHACADPNQEWKKRKCEDHETAMLAVLQQALGVESVPSAR